MEGKKILVKSTDIVKNLLLLCDRPNEPLINPKGEKNVLFKLTNKLKQFLPPGYEDNGLDLNERFEEDAQERIDLKPLQRIPEYRHARQLPADADFSLFIPKHQQMATEVIDEMMRVPEDQLEDFLSTCAYARVHLNPQLFNYCFSVALLHRRDTRNIPFPNFAETFPAKFVDSQVFQKARESTAVLKDARERIPIVIPRDYTATDLELEHRLAYFREDIGVNLHHWHWHLVYPSFIPVTDPKNPSNSIVDKNRRGELFYYMHQQIIARYNCERLNSLKGSDWRVQKFNNWTEPIKEAYFPKLDSLTSSRGWPPRQADQHWRNIDRPAEGLNITVLDMERWRRNIQDAIASGTYQTEDGQVRPLDIDTLGNIIEASVLSPNKQLYGNMHNDGHLFTACLHDPEHRYLESFSVMADEATTMRDPFFYRWHAFIDDLFQKHKESPAVPAYTRSELANDGVTVTSVRVENLEGGGQPNTLNTFWMSSDVDLSRGLDFSNRGPVYARFTHLNHRAFQYVIKVNSDQAKRATCRIFLGPKFDERNRPMALADQRKMFVEMDRFVTELNTGQNTITRRSTASSVTIPFEQTFRDLSRQGKDPPRQGDFCGCGWPQHMLVPKGTEAGITYQLFVMLSNYELDRIDPEQTGGREMTCKEASSYCGVRDKLYPDRRSMGFPFDRPSRDATSIDDFRLSNMGMQDVTIRLQNVTEPNPRNPKN